MGQGRRQASGTKATAEPSPGMAAPVAAAVAVAVDATSSRFEPRIGRIPVLAVGPVVDGGRWPARAVVGEQVPVTGTVFREGHDPVSATAVLVRPDGSEHSRARLRSLGPGLDRFGAVVIPDAEGRWSFRVEGWGDPFGGWVHDAAIKVSAEVDVDLMLEAGARLLERALAESTGRTDADLAVLQDAVVGLRDTSRPAQARLAAGTSPGVHAAMDRAPLRDLVTASDTYPLTVQRERALFSAWYELFPRSEGAYWDEQQQRMVSGTFATAAERLPAIADLGFDIVYLPPVHPIGRVNRKGPNNTLAPGPHDPGSPWAIGSDQGGHDALHPDLGDFDDFDAFVSVARGLGLEVALDLALQCAPDHPWATQHPEWFTTRLDGTIAYAENPPKKYQDIYPVNFDNDPAGIYAEVLRVVLLWVEHGVTLFRVDNPHTKPVQFWEWLIAEVAGRHPEVVFLAEAFTRPAMMHTLAKVGFHQSYTYFTWRNTKEELTEYFTELAQGPGREYFRPNVWPNTPDILHAQLQGGEAAVFQSRLVLAATLAANYGMYGPPYELREHLPRGPASEEYLDSEKYQLRRWELARPDSLRPFIAQVNRIRHANLALQADLSLRFLAIDNDQLIAYAKASPDGGNVVVTVVNLDPQQTQSGWLELDPQSIGVAPDHPFQMHDMLSDQRFTWQGGRHFVVLDPHAIPAHILVVRRRSERDFDHYQ